MLMQNRQLTFYEANQSNLGLIKIKLALEDFPLVAHYRSRQLWKYMKKIYRHMQISNNPLYPILPAWFIPESTMTFMKR